MADQLGFFGSTGPRPKPRGIRALPLPEHPLPEPAPRPEALASLRTRALAARAARAIRAACQDPSTAGEASMAHILMSRPRRGVWLKTWSKLPGLVLDLGARTYTHELLPGWQYTPAEMKTEMVEDLEHFAETGEQPKVATS